MQDSSGSNTNTDTDDSSDRTKKSKGNRKAASSPGKSKKSQSQSTAGNDDGWETQQDDQYESSEPHEQFDVGSGSTSWESSDHEDQSSTDDGNEHDDEQGNGHYEHSNIHFEAGYEAAFGSEETYSQQEVLSEYGQGHAGPTDRRVWELRDEVHPEPHNDPYLAHGNGSYLDVSTTDGYGPQWRQEQHQRDYYGERAIYDENPSYAEGQDFVEERRYDPHWHVTDASPAHEEATYYEHGYRSYQEAGFKYHYQHHREAREQEHTRYEPGYELEEVSAHGYGAEGEMQYEGQQYDGEQYEGHQYDAAHQYDVAHQYDLAHQYDEAHQ